LEASPTYAFAQPLSRALSIASGSCAVVRQDSRRTYAELGARCRRLGGARLAPAEMRAHLSGRVVKAHPAT
jgi:hypothetical protein